MFEIGQKAEENMQPSNELCFLISYQVTFFFHVPDHNNFTLLSSGLWLLQRFELQ